MKIIRILILICFTLEVSSQTIDSLTFDSNNNTIRIFGQKMSTGRNITKIETTCTDSVYISLYFSDCAGYLSIEPYDTTINNFQNFPSIPKEIVIYSIVDTNTIDENCFYHDTFELIQTFKYYNIPDELNESTNDNLLIIDYSTKTIYIDTEKSNLLSIYNILGKLVFTNKNNQNNISFSELEKGEYFIILKTKNENIRQKIIIK